MTTAAQLARAASAIHRKAMGRCVVICGAPKALRDTHLSWLQQDASVIRVWAPYVLVE